MPLRISQINRRLQPKRSAISRALNPAKCSFLTASSSSIFLGRPVGRPLGGLLIGSILARFFCVCEILRFRPMLSSVGLGDGYPRCIADGALGGSTIAPSRILEEA